MQDRAKPETLCFQVNNESQSHESVTAKSQEQLDFRPQMRAQDFFIIIIKNARRQFMIKTNKTCWKPDLIGQLKGI